MFADYDYYTSVYGGEVIPLAQYARSEAKAAAFIGELTFSRVVKLPFVPEEVKQASCAGAEVFYKYDKILAELSPCIKSETVDGYSVSFAGTNEIRQQCRAEAEDTISVYLPRSHSLRYRGVSYG